MTRARLVWTCPPWVSEKQLLAPTAHCDDTGPDGFMEMLKNEERGWEVEQAGAMTSELYRNLLIAPKWDSGLGISPCALASSSLKWR